MHSGPAQLKALYVAPLQFSAARALDALTLPVRVDGELAFADGSAIAWREYLQWADGRVDCVLVKSRTSVQLLDPAKIPDRGMPCIA